MAKVKKAPPPLVRNEKIPKLVKAFDGSDLKKWRLPALLKERAALIRDAERGRPAPQALAEVERAIEERS